MDSGRVVDDGQYEELLARGGGFARLMEAHRLRDQNITDAQQVGLRVLCIYLCCYGARVFFFLLFYFFLFF